MKKKVNGYEARSDKVIKFGLTLLLLVASLMPLTVSADTTPSTPSTVTATPTSTPTPTPTPTAPRLHSVSEPVSEPVQQQATPAVSWNS